MKIALWGMFFLLSAQLCVLMLVTILAEVDALKERRRARKERTIHTFDDFCATLSLDQITWMLQNPGEFTNLPTIVQQAGRAFYFGRIN